MSDHHHNLSDKKERDFENRAETRPPSTSATTSTWSRFNDPRVVRVSRALGRKDRHSKVCTVRGLRDRRVRLSVPTAIQLYDLQERLGLNQPSKVVDWLLDASKLEIDRLPPLHFPQGMMFNYNQLDQPMMNFQDFAAGSQLPEKRGLKTGDWDDNNKSVFKMDPSSLTLFQHEDWHGFGLLPFHQQGAGIMSTQHEVNSFQRSQPSNSSFSSTIDPKGQPAVRQMHFNMTANLLPTQDSNGETET